MPGLTPGWGAMTEEVRYELVAQKIREQSEYELIDSGPKLGPLIDIGRQLTQLFELGDPNGYQQAKILFEGRSAWVGWARPKDWNEALKRSAEIQKEIDL